jgi:hypothetical protein
MNASARLERFLDFSSEVTGFSVFDLEGTGQAQSFLGAVTGVVGNEIVDELLEAYVGVGEHDGLEERQAGLRRAIFSDEKLGPIARNVIKLWYVGIWTELPAEWTDVYGAHENDHTFTVSPAAYTEALLWPAIGANPPGAKGPGYGNWALPPKLAPEGPVR